MKIPTFIFIASIFLVLTTHAQYGSIDQTDKKNNQQQSVDFENQYPAGNLQINSKGQFIIKPEFGKTKAIAGEGSFRFGLSTCEFNCDDDFTSTLKISYDKPTWVEGLTFAELERGKNFGSVGSVFIDGHIIEKSLFGRYPSNDMQADTEPRYHGLEINQRITTIEFKVRNITNLSQIYLDNINVYFKSMPQFHTADSRSTLLEAGYLDITTNYSGAQIFVNDNFMGISPLKQKIFASDELAITVIKDDLVTERFTVPVEKNTTTGISVNMVQQPPSLKHYYRLADFGWETKTWENFYIEPSGQKPEATKKFNSGKKFWWWTGLGVGFIGISRFANNGNFTMLDLLGGGFLITGLITGVKGELKPNKKNIDYNEKLKSQQRVLAKNKAAEYNADLYDQLTEKNKPIKEENNIIQAQRNEIQSEHTIFYQVGKYGEEKEIKTYLPE